MEHGPDELLPLNSFNNYLVQSDGHKARKAAFYDLLDELPKDKIECIKTKLNDYGEKWQEERRKQQLNAKRLKLYEKLVIVLTYLLNRDKQIKLSLSAYATHLSKFLKRQPKQIQLLLSKTDKWYKQQQITKEMPPQQKKDIDLLINPPHTEEIVLPKSQIKETKPIAFYPQQKKQLKIHPQQQLQIRPQRQVIKRSQVRRVTPLMVDQKKAKEACNTTIKSMRNFIQKSQATIFQAYQLISQLPYEHKMKEFDLEDCSKKIIERQETQKKEEMILSKIQKEVEDLERKKEAKLGTRKSRSKRKNSKMKSKRKSRSQKKQESKSQSKFKDVPQLFKGEK